MRNVEEFVGWGSPLNLHIALDVDSKNGHKLHFYQPAANVTLFLTSFSITHFTEKRAGVYETWFRFVFMQLLSARILSPLAEAKQRWKRGSSSLRLIVLWFPCVAQPIYNSEFIISTSCYKVHFIFSFAWSSTRCDAKKFRNNFRTSSLSCVRQRLHNANNKKVFRRLFLLLMIFLSQLIFNFNPKWRRKKNFQLVQIVN